MVPRVNRFHHDRFSEREKSDVHAAQDARAGEHKNESNTAKSALASGQERLEKLDPTFIRLLEGIDIEAATEALEVSDNENISLNQSDPGLQNALQILRQRMSALDPAKQDQLKESAKNVLMQEIQRENVPGLKDEAEYVRQFLLNNSEFQTYLQSYLGDDLRVSFTQDSKKAASVHLRWGNGDADQRVDVAISRSIRIDGASDEDLQQIVGRLINEHIPKKLGIEMTDHRTEFRDKRYELSPRKRLQLAIETKTADVVVMLVLLFLGAKARLNSINFNFQIEGGSATASGTARLKAHVLETVLGAEGISTWQTRTNVLNPGGGQVKEKDMQETISKFQHSLNMIEQLSSALANAQSSHSRALVITANNIKG